MPHTMPHDPIHSRLRARTLRGFWVLCLRSKRGSRRLPRFCFRFSGSGRHRAKPVLRLPRFRNGKGAGIVFDLRFTVSLNHRSSEAVFLPRGEFRAEQAQADYTVEFRTPLQEYGGIVNGRDVPMLLGQGDPPFFLPVPYLREQIHPAR